MIAEGAFKVLIAGANGQLGTLLRSTVPHPCDLLAFGSADLDVANRDAVFKAVQAFRPHWVVNAAAFTAVDQAEAEHRRAYAVNADGACYLAEAAAASGSRLLQVSTDFVFDGAQCLPYVPDDRPNPLNVYGASKLAGEQAAREVLGDDAVIVRTAWVYAGLGRNFVQSMLRLLAEREVLTVVDDQVGTPTAAEGLARALWQVMDRNLTGTFHWTDAGVASWYDFAVAIRDEALICGLLSRPTPVVPIPTSEFPRPARRPLFSVLDKRTTWQALEVRPLHWRDALRRVLEQQAFSQLRRRSG